MVREANAKVATLIVSVIVITLSAFNIDVDKVGICVDSSVYARLFYSFFHASIFHALANSWCLLSLVFMYDVPMWKLVLAYIISVTFPVNSISCIDTALYVPTVGLSAICFAVMGLLAFSVKRKLYFMIWVSVFVCIGLVLPKVNGIIHLYCYIVGAVFGFLNMPINDKAD